MKFLLIFIILISFKLKSERLMDRGLFCKLDSNDIENILFEAYLFKSKTFISLYLEISDSRVFIKESLPTIYNITDKHIILKGIKVEKKKLKYTTMGGTFYCQMLSKRLLIESVRKMQKLKTARLRKNKN